MIATESGGVDTGIPQSQHRFAPVIVAGAGALTALAFPEPGLFPLAWFGVAPLIVLTRAVSARRGIGLGLLWGLGFFGVLIYWISIVGVVAWIGLVVLQSLFLGVFGGAWASISRRLRASWATLVVPAVLWIALAEAARGNLPLGGFTWGQLAQSQTSFPPMMRLSSVAGAWGTAFVIVVVNMLVVSAVTRIRARSWHAIAPILGATALLIVPLLVPVAAPDGGSLRVAIVQGNIPRAMEPSREKNLLIMRSHRHLTEKLRDIDLAVWPESAIGSDPGRDEEARLAIADAARASGAYLLVGGDLDRDDGQRQVMAYLVTPEGEIVDGYQKTHLVPFGEFVPARGLLGGIPALQQVPRDAVPGTEPALFEIAGAPVAPVISFEGDFGPLVRERIGRGGRILIVATNTSTWGDSWASAQHLAMARLRAAENGVPVVHAALTGISAFISPEGRVQERTEMWTPAVLSGEVSFPAAISLYARMGDWFAWACVAAGLAVAVMTFRGRARRPSA